MRLMPAVFLLGVLQTGAHAQATVAGPYETYRAAVAAFVKSGDISSAVTPLERWSRTEFDTATKAASASKNPDDLRAASVFHLEIGVAIVGLSPGAAARHFKYGEDLLDRWTASKPILKSRVANDESAFRATWYGVAGSATAAVKDINRAGSLLGRAVSIQPRSARALTLRGALKELQASLFDPEDAPTLSRRERIRRERDYLLHQAKQDFEQALRYDDRYAPAVIRRGRVLHLFGQLAEAGAELERGKAMAADQPTKYLAALFMGALQQETEDVNGARRSFEEAIAIAPTSQPPVVALAHLELMAGRPDRASALAHALAKATVTGQPWWVYHHGALDVSGLQWLRAQVAP